MTTGHDSTTHAAENEPSSRRANAPRATWYIGFRSAPSHGRTWLADNESPTSD